MGKLTLAGYLHNDPGLPKTPMRILGSYAVVYLWAGHGRFRDATGRSQNVRAGDLLLLFPDVAHSYGPKHGRDWNELYIVFDGPIFDVWRSHGLLSPKRPVSHLEPIEYWLNRFGTTLQASAASEQERSLQRVCKLQEVLAEALAYEKQQTMGGREEAWLARAYSLLQAGDPPKTRTLEDVAEVLGMSYVGFRKKFARLAGVSPAKWRARRNIEHACYLIKQDTLSLREIALALGFCDEFHFSKRFKQTLGLSPSEFRRHM